MFAMRLHIFPSLVFLLTLILDKEPILAMMGVGGDGRQPHQHHHSASTSMTDKSCGSIPLDKMVPFVYIPDEEFGKIGAKKSINKETSILWDHRSIGHGAFAEVRVGYFGLNGDNFSKANCVAIRVTPKRKTIEGENNLKTIRAIHARLTESERSLIVRTVDAHNSGCAQGKVMETDDYVTIMELAQGNYEQHLMATKHAKELPNETEMRNEIGKIVEPLRQFHMIGVHLDLKLTNYVATIDENHNEVVKLIDFGSSTLFNGHHHHHQHSHSHIGVFDEAAARVNFPIVPLWRKRLDEVAGPEFNHSTAADQGENFSIQVTTKADIWSIGILIYAMQLLPFYRGIELAEEKRKSMQLLLEEIAAIYRGFRWVERAGRLEKEVLLYDRKWLLDYSEAILVILEMRRVMPHIFLMSTNILHLIPRKRMSASGLLHALSGQCRPLLEYAPNSGDGKGDKDLVLFGKINARKLSLMADDALTNNNKLQMHDQQEVVSKKMEQIHKMLVDERETVNFNRVLREVEQRGEVCAH